MHEQKNKDIKNINKKNIEGIKQLFVEGAADLQMNFILDSIVQFLTGKEAASFSQNGSEFFTDEATLGAALRKIKPENLDKDHLKRIAHKIKIDSDGQPGEVYNHLQKTENAARYLLFYSHFKILFKMVQIGLSVKRVKNIQRKLDKDNATATELANQLKDENAVLDELKVTEQMVEEAERMRAEEIRVLSEKRDQLTRRIQELSSKDITSNYKAW